MTLALYDENGFLCGKIRDWITEHREAHQCALAPALELNRQCHIFVDGRTVTVSDSYQLTNLVLFVRLMELYQGVLITVDHGMRAPTRIIFRAFLEAFFHFSAIHKDRKYLDDYLEQFKFQEKKTDQPNTPQ